MKISDIDFTNADHLEEKKDEVVEIKVGLLNRLVNFFVNNVGNDHWGNVMLKELKEHNPGMTREQAIEHLRDIPAWYQDNGDSESTPNTSSHYVTVDGDVHKDGLKALIFFLEERENKNG